MNTKKLNRKIGKTTYIVKPEEKMVIGILECNKDAYGEFRNALGSLKYSQMFDFLYERSKDSVGKKIKAVARCADGDEFDVDTGKKIVDLRLNVKWNTYMWRKFAKAEIELSNIIDKIRKAREKYLTVALDAEDALQYMDFD